jgi:tetratricopeptide (TPR) repeat protein/GTPase SAR1 family protein
LLERSVLGSLLQTESLGRLRRLVHDNLIEFDPASDREPALMQRTPRRLERADVVAALDVYRPSGGREPSFQVVDRTFLSEQRELPRELYVARAPEWSDLVHGQDPEIKFLEREQTADLQNAVLEHLVKPMQRRSGRLPALFVVGPPGSGKTTLVRRVAARLVDDGQILVADAGVGWREPAGDPEEYVEALTRLQAAGRPVVLLLDDPLYAESGWFDVFKRLNRPNLIAGILSATPQFLFDGHKHALRPLNHREYPIAPPSRAERTQLADLFRSKRQFDDRSDDDFLVLTIELAAGVSFDEIIDRLWTTLADGRDLGGFHTFESLPWQVRAFVFVCFFSRVYEQCPEPLLREALQLSGGVEGAGDVTTELARLRHQQGWRIFRIGRRARTAWDYQGVPISASHTQIARRAWQRRPLPWCDVEEVWLDDHADDTCVRTQCLTYLRKLPDDEFGRDRRQAAEETARWLEEHGGTSDIRMGFVAFAVQVATKGEPVFVAAEKQCQLLASELPNSVEVKHLCGKLLLKSERFSEAAHQFREALQIYPEHQAARWELGTALWKLNDFENAEREFRSAIHSAERKKNPRAPFYTSLGWLYVDWRRWRDAINAFQSARDECPDFFGNHWGIGRAEFELGDYDLAAESLRRALETPNLKPPASDEIPALLQECLKQAER